MMAPTFKTFWMVKAEHRIDTTVKHLTFEAAKREAERLAAAIPNTTFYVLAAVGGARVERPAVWVDADQAPPF